MPDLILIADNVLRIAGVLSLTYAGIKWVPRLWSTFTWKRKMLRQAGSTTNPYVLVVSFGEDRIETAVRNFMRTVAPHAPIEVYHESSDITPANLDRHLSALRKLKSLFQEKGATELHVFLKTPVALGMVLGVLFDNWIDVYIYHKQRDGFYTCWTTVSRVKAVRPDDPIEEYAMRLLMPDGTPSSSATSALPTKSV